ncbi:alpha/beta hydrolase fold domain-containing protein [Streptomyces sp. NPDC020817]|uniref:alpha/beta hydrolase fold domain-containing protein n=1 Tax=Streptomyces sp. NPDC020817 TaxID=3365095 RepID=UPI0037B53479
MSKEQRARVDAMLRRPPADGPLPVEALRAGSRALMDTVIVPDAVRTAQTTLGGLRALHLEPGSGARPATILYFHGGGWVFGSPETALCLTAQLVDRTGFQAYSVDCRLAPEHPFPAAIDDTLSAYRALLDTGLDPSTIAFAGDSACGCLTVTTALASRPRSPLPQPARQHREHGADPGTIGLTPQRASLQSRAPGFGPPGPTWPSPPDPAAARPVPHLRTQASIRVNYPANQVN